MTAIGEPFRQPTTSVVTPPRTAGWQETYAKALVAVDFVAVVLAVTLAQLAALRRTAHDRTSAHTFGELGHLLLQLPGGVAAHRHRLDAGPVDQSISGARHHRSGVEEYRRVCVSTAATFGSIAIISMAFKLEIARGYLLIALPSGIALLLLFRWLARHVVLKARKNSGRCVTPDSGRWQPVGGPRSRQVPHHRHRLRIRGRRSMHSRPSYADSARHRRSGHHPDIR